jgi:hypothetical protein
MKRPRNRIDGSRLESSDAPALLNPDIFWSSARPAELFTAFRAFTAVPVVACVVDRKKQPQ